jgi:hypothetical protein
VLVEHGLQHIAKLRKARHERAVIPTVLLTAWQ